MDILLRLLLRIVLVPLGYLAAVLAGALVIIFGAWRLGDILSSPDPDAPALALFGLVFAGPILLALLTVLLWLPAAIGILLAEAFAIRSWIYHAANGAIAAWIGWKLIGAVHDTPLPLLQPLHIVAAGLAGGFAYWAIAGWSAGFWKPVFRRERPAVVVAPGATIPR